jgi:polyisoprenoid-binding protein YceI
MLKHTVVIAVAGALALGISTLGVAGKPSSTSGSWQVDSQRSDAQLITDAWTDWGKTKINFTLGFARVNGGLKLDDADPANSKLDFLMYPSSSLASPIGEDGKVKASWLANVANHTLVCFHSKKVVRTPDGKLQTTGDLTLTRVDRDLQYNPGEDYRGPVYGPPIVRRVSREATFVFDLTPAGQKAAAITASGSTSIAREGFPQLVRAVVSTHWPPLVMDKDCQNPAGGTGDYRGFRCTGTFMEASGLPEAPLGEGYPDPSDFNTIVGNQLNILVHLRLTPTVSGASAAGGS